jgi:exopolysaccharide production protein ExoZ
MPKRESKILGVQYLRGLAALGVVLCHFGSSLSSYPKLSSIFNFGQNGVDVFFLISGFIIVYSLIIHEYQVKQFFTFMIKRSVRIDPAYIVVIILTLALFNILAALPSFKGQGIPFVPAQFLAHLFYVVPFTKYPFYNHVFWTLCVEFQLYILIGLLFFLSNNKIYRAVFLIIFCGLSFINWPNGYYVVFTYSPIFATGMALLMFKLDKNRFNASLTLLFLIITAINLGWPIAMLLLFSCLGILYFNVNLPLLTFLGNVSYSLYLTHSLTYIVLTGIAKRLNLNMTENQLLWLAVEVLIAIFVAYGFYLLIEKPSLRLSKRFFYRKSKPLTSFA